MNRAYGRFAQKPGFLELLMCTFFMDANVHSEARDPLGCHVFGSYGPIASAL
jgi:hypothetical protein